MAIDKIDHLNPEKRNRLVDAVRDIKIATAERSDVVIEMKEADRARIEILAQELEHVFAEVPAEDERFDFTISSGIQPRLWIDATAHVIMGKDRRQYRFVRDTRMGRVVLAESNQTAPVAQAITKYIAERMYERELALAGDDISYRPGIAQRTALSTHTPEKMEVEAGIAQVSDEKAAVPQSANAIAEMSDGKNLNMAARDRDSKTAMSTMGWIILGLLLAGGALLLAYRDVIFPTIT